MQVASIKKLWRTNLVDLLVNAYRVMDMLRRTEPLFFFTAIFLSIGMALVPFLIAYLSALFINLITSGSFKSILDPSLLWIASLYLVLPFINEQMKNLYNYQYRQFRIRFEQTFQIVHLKKRAEIDIQTHEDSKFSNFAKLVDENDFRYGIFLSNLLGLISVITSAVVAFTILFSNNKLLASLLLLALVPQFVVQLRYGRQTWGIWGARAELRRKFSEYQKPFYNLSGLIELRTYAAKAYFARAIDVVLSVFNGEVGHAERARFLLQFGAELIFFVIAGIYTISLMGSAVTGALAVGTFLFLLGRISDVQYQVSSLIFNIASLISDSLFVTDIHTFLDTEPVLKDGKRMTPSKTPTIAFDHVSFGYPHSPLVLKDLTFTIVPGEKVAIVGLNGAGKTTLTKLLMRFYDPTQGSILISDEPLMELKVTSWLSGIAYLPQDYMNYKLPVKEAIALGNPNIPIDEARVREAARKAGADEFIAKWPKGYDTPLGKEFDGEEPSVGQWQKLALARMFYKRANILILDEPTSSIDAIAELAIFNELENLPDDTSVILISHRFNTVKNADKIIVIEHGTIAEMGTHEELMQKKGHYHTLFTSQKDSYGTEA